MFSATVPSNRKLSCSTTPRWRRYSVRRRSIRSRPSTQHPPCRRPVERHHQADERALAGSATIRPARWSCRPRAVNVTSFRTGVPGLYSNDTCSNSMSPRKFVQRRAVRVVGVLARRVEDFVDAIETGERFRDLRADRRDLDDRQRHHAGEDDVGEQIARASSSWRRCAWPPTMIMTTPMAPTTTLENAVGGRDAGHRLRDVPEQPVRALREDQILATLGGVGLHDAHAAQRLIQAAGHFRRDLAALAEQRPQRLERVAHRAAEKPRARGS